MSNITDTRQSLDRLNELLELEIVKIYVYRSPTGLSHKYSFVSKGRNGGYYESFTSKNTITSYRRFLTFCFGYGIGVPARHKDWKNTITPLIIESADEIVATHVFNIGMTIRRTEI